MRASQMNEEQHEALWEKAKHAGMSRREFLILLATGGVGAVLSACASAVTPSPTSAPAAATAAPTTAPTVAATATIVRPTATLPPPTPSGPVGDLRIGVASFGQESFDVFYTSLADTWSRLAPMFDYLIRMDPSEKNNLGIAEKWEMAPDGKSWTFYLRKGVKFHDGTPLTANDVKFTLDQYATERAFYADIRSAQDRVEVVDDYTVRVYTKGEQPYYYRLVDFSVAQQGLIVPKSYYEKVGKDAFAQKPIGSGPFKFVRSVAGDMVQYEAFDGHYRQVPAFKTLTTTLVPEEATRLAMLKTGSLDAIEMGVDSVPDVEAAGLRTVSLNGVQVGVYFYGSYDPRAKGLPTADVRVRQALSLAINREEIGKTLFSGKLPPPMPPSIRANQPEIDVAYWSQQAAKYYRFDPAAATQLLKDAGFPQGFTLKLFSYELSGAPLGKLAEIIQGYWLKIGVKTEIVKTEWGAFRPSIKSGPNGGPADNVVGTVCLHRTDGSVMPGRALTAPFLSSGSFGLAQKALPELEQLIQLCVTEPDPAKRRDTIAKAIQQCMDTHTVSVIGTVPAMVGLGPRVTIDFPKDPGALVQYVDIAKHGKT